MFSGLDLSKAVRLTPTDWSWEFVDRLRALTKMKVVLKGIVTREDAELARKHGVDGVIVSNHGGRSEDSGRGTIESVREVVEGVAGAMPVLVDSGFRRGTDIFKALALGATAVCIGRPYVWGLAAFGQPGVEAVLDHAAAGARDRHAPGGHAVARAHRLQLRHRSRPLVIPTLTPSAARSRDRRASRAAPARTTRRARRRRNDSEAATNVVGVERRQTEQHPFE